MVPSVAVAIALWTQTPSDAEIQRANGQMLAFGIEALQNQGVTLPAELTKQETYWAGSQPVQHWTSESRRLAFETFADASEKKSDVRTLSREIGREGRCLPSSAKTPTATI
jgi:hypothetical protein